MSNKYPQKGNSDTILLFTFALIFILGIVGLPKFLKWRNESNVPPEVRLLRRIHAAQTKYRDQISLKNTYGSFKQLAETKVLPDCATCAADAYQLDGQTFSLDRNYEETRFCVSSAKYAMNTDGRIYEGAACSMGEVAGTNLKEFTGKK